MRFHYITPLLAAAGAAAYIAITPTASAATGADPQSCTSMGVDSYCQSPGNVQINDSPPAQYVPQYPYWERNVFGVPTHRRHR